MSTSTWVKSDTTPTPPGDIPDGMYEFRFRVSQLEADVAQAEFWTNNFAGSTITVAPGQTFSPVSTYTDKDNDDKALDLVILADVKGFWPELVAIVIAGIIAYETFHEIRLVSNKVGGQLFLAGSGLILILVAGFVIYSLAKHKGD